MDTKRIFITGAGSGIGKATAVLFHREGWTIGACDSSQSALDSLSSELTERCTTHCVDVREKSELEAALASFCADNGGQLDIMFNNAGIAIGGYFEDLPFEKTRDMIDINLVGVLNGFYAAIPYLKLTEGALCISTSSSAAIYGAAGMATYTATKYAVKGFTHAMSVEFSRFGVRVADVMPGIIDTPLWGACATKTAGRLVPTKKFRSSMQSEQMKVERLHLSRSPAPYGMPITVIVCIGTCQKNLNRVTRKPRPITRSGGMNF